MNHTCGFASFSSPASIVNASSFPSGDHARFDTLFSPRVNCRAAVDGPTTGTTHKCVTDFQVSLSFSVEFSATRYATLVPSGEIRGELTRATRKASADPNNFFPSLLF